MNRTAEFVLGLIGGVFGFISAIFALFIGGVDAAINEGVSEVTGKGWAAFFFSTLAIVGSVVIRSKGKVGGFLLLIAAVGGLFSIAKVYLVPTILIGIAGFMGIIKDEQKENVA